VSRPLRGPRSRSLLILRNRSRRPESPVRRCSSEIGRDASRRVALSMDTPIRPVSLGTEYGRECSPVGSSRRNVGGVLLRRRSRPRTCVRRFLGVDNPAVLPLRDTRHVPVARWVRGTADVPCGEDGPLEPEGRRSRRRRRVRRDDIPRSPSETGLLGASDGHLSQRTYSPPAPVDTGDARRDGVAVSRPWKPRHSVRRRLESSSRFWSPSGSSVSRPPHRPRSCSARAPSRRPSRRPRTPGRGSPR